MIINYPFPYLSSHWILSEWTCRECQRADPPPGCWSCPVMSPACRPGTRRTGELGARSRHRSVSLSQSGPQQPWSLTCWSQLWEHVLSCRYMLIASIKVLQSLLTSAPPDSLCVQQCWQRHNYNDQHPRPTPLHQLFYQILWQCLYMLSMTGFMPLYKLYFTKWFHINISILHKFWFFNDFNFILFS